MAEVTIAVHGGAGRPPARLRDEAGFHAGLRAGLAAGHAVLAGGGPALDAVEAAVCVLEDDPRFNAGRGSVLTEAGEVEMDAAAMCGASSRAGAVGAVRGVRHPVALARAVLEEGRHVLLVGPGAEALAAELGLERCPAGWFVTDRRRRQWRRRAGAPGTVGAVALDAGGRLAAATSTGGVGGQRAGRVGDSALIGAGTWADERCAVSATGDGEALIRSVAGHAVAVRLAAGQGLEQAAGAVVRGALAAAGADAGMIALDREGRVALPVNCGLMHRGVRRGGGEPWTAVLAPGPG